MSDYRWVNCWVSIGCVSLGILGFTIVLFGEWGSHLPVAVLLGVASLIVLFIGVSE